MASQQPQSAITTANSSAFVFPINLVVGYLQNVDLGPVALLSERSFLPLLLSIIVLYYRQPRVVASNWLLYAKLLAAGILGYVQVLSALPGNAMVEHVSSFYPSSTHAAVPYAIAIGLFVIVKLEHHCTPKSSARLAIWLSVAALLDAQRLHRHHSRQPEPYAAVCYLPTTLALKLMLILLEEFPKLRTASRNGEADWPRRAKATSFAGFWTRSLLICLNPTIPSLFGSHAPLSHHYLEKRASAELLKEAKPSSSWLLLTLCKPLTGFLIALCSSRAILTVCKLSQVTLLIQVIIFMEKQDNTLAAQLVVTTATLVVHFGIAFSRCLFKGLCDSMLVHVREALMQRIHRKLLSVKDVRRYQAELDKIESHIEGLVNGITNVADSIAVVVEMFVAMKWLMQLVGNPILFLFILPTVYGFVVKYSGRGLPEAQKALEAAASLRVQKTSSLLAQIKAIRLAKVQNDFTKAIKAFRLAEIAKLTEIFHGRQVLTTINSIFWTFPGPFVFGVLSWYSRGNPSSSVIIHPSLAAIALFVNAAMDTVRNVDKAKTMMKCSESIQRILLLKENTPGATRPVSVQEPISNHPVKDSKIGQKSLAGLLASNDGVRPLLPQPSEFIVEAVGASLAADMSSKKPLLKNFSLNIKRCELAMVAGPSGSGKSVFLHSILGPEALLSGKFQKSIGLTGYCSQIPWLQHISIRENITGCNRFETDWYNRVVNACLLDKDFTRLTGGDLAVVGNHGLNLSRGQRCRIALARALYSRAPCLILDNAFAGLDGQSCNDMFSRIFGENGICHRQRTSVIMTTNSRELLRKADRTILIDKTGHISNHTDHGTEYRNRLRNLVLSKDDDDDDNKLTNYQTTSNSVTEPNPFEISASKHDDNYMAACYLYVSSLDWESIKRQRAYLVSAVVFIACSDAFPCLWLSVWSPGYIFLTAYCAISALSCFLFIQLCRIWYLEFAVLPASDIHQKLLDTVTSANLSFVTQFSHSSMLNLFDDEMRRISEDLPTYFLRVVVQGSANFAQLCLIAIIARYGSIYFVIYATGFSIALYFYLQLSRPAQISDSKAKAVMRANLADTITGVRHVKAFGWEQQAVSDADKLLEKSQDHLHYTRTIDRWMYLATEASRSLALVTAIVLVTFCQMPIPILAVGLMVVLPMKAEDSTPILVEDCAILRNSLQTLGAGLKFIEKAPLETGGASEDLVLDSNWPHNGEVIFSNVTAKYNEKCSAPPVLKNASFNITSGHKIGVVGKSGSGKSSVLMALLNSLDHQGDIEIDGKNLRQLSIRQLRKHINIISQDRIDLGGTVEHNLFPKLKPTTGGGLNPQVIQVVLESLGLYDLLAAPAKGLLADMASLNLSDGQHRVISVARGMFEALNGGGNLVVVDDMTGNLDPTTENLVFDALMEAFTDHTVIMEVSRADQMKRCDSTIHMVDGRVSEFRHNPSGPAAKKADQKKNKELNLTRAREAQAEVNTTLKPGTKMQNSEIGPVPVADAYIKLMDVTAGVPGVSIEPPHQEGIAALRAAAAALQASIEASVSGAQTTAVASGSGSQVQTVEASGSGSGSQVQTTEASGSQTQATSASGLEVQASRASGSEVQTTMAQDPKGKGKAKEVLDPKGKGKAKEVLEPESETTEAPERDVQTTEPLDPKGKGKAKEVLDPKGKGKAKEVL